MMLSDRDIFDLVSKGGLISEGFREENLTPNGYDLTVGELFIPDSGGDRVTDGQVAIPALSWFLVGTTEVVNIPSGISGQLWIRTSWARRGIIGSFGKIDAGFRGNLTLSAFNASKVSVPISTGDRFAQIAFIHLSQSSEKSYEERSGNYQNQRGITLEPNNIIR